MTKIDIYSGFLGAGKTTLIRKLVAEAYKGQKIVIIENEFGEIGIDSGFLADAGVEIHEMNSGCICCSLTGDFKEALKMVVRDYNPDRIIIEPSGVGKLSEVAAAVMATGSPDLELGGLTTVVDASKCKMYMKNFGEFFNDQIESAHGAVRIAALSLCSRRSATASDTFASESWPVRLKMMQWADSIWSLKNSPKFFMYILHFDASTTVVRPPSSSSSEPVAITAAATSESLPTPEGSITIRSGV